MNVLLVDNKSAHLELLTALITEKLGAVSFRFHDPRDIQEDDVAWADLIVVSGGVGRSIVKNPQTFGRIVDMSVAKRKPTIGICLGAQAIAHYYGSSLTEMPVRRVGNVRMHFQGDASNILGSESEMVYEFHKWKVMNVNQPLVCLATSKDGVELFRHRDLPMWGLQFHPEVRRLDNKGHLLFAHILHDILPRTV